jgi:hypothetical protein
MQTLSRCLFFPTRSTVNPLFDGPGESDTRQIYIEGVAHAASDKAEFEVKLKRRKGDAKGSLTRLIDRKAALYLVDDKSLDDEELASAVE